MDCSLKFAPSNVPPSSSSPCNVNALSPSSLDLSPNSYPRDKPVNQSCVLWILETHVLVFVTRKSFQRNREEEKTVWSEIYIEREGDKSDENDEYFLFKLLSRNMRKIKKQRIKLNLYVFNFFIKYIELVSFFEIFIIKIFIIHKSLFQYND